MTGWTDAARKASAAARAARAKGKTQHAANINKAVTTAQQLGLTGSAGSSPTPRADPSRLLSSSPHPGFKPPESIARHQARLVPGSDRSNTRGGEAPSETMRKQIEALQADIKAHGDASRSGGGEKAQRIKYIKGRMKEQKSREDSVRRSQQPRTPAPQPQHNHMRGMPSERRFRAPGAFG